MTDSPRKGTDNVRHWQYLTGSDFKRLDKSKVVVTVACSPLEVHGPHLPVICDYLEAEGLTTRTIELLKDRHSEMIFLRLPPIYVAADVLPHTGSLTFRTSTIVRVLSDLGRTLAKQGFRNIWVSSFHGGPRHFVAIEQACHLTNKRYGARMVSLFSVLAKRLSEGPSNLSEILGRIPGLTPADLHGDTHGGAIETSVLLYLVGDCVDPVYRDCERMTADVKLAREGLPPRASKRGGSPASKFFRGFKASLKYFEDETYSGKPAIASAEIGRQVLDELAGRSLDTLSDLWTGKLDPKDCHSPAWPLRWILLSAPVMWAFERAVKYRNPIF